MLDAVPSISQQTFRVALVGNPNTGKSALFNSLTGLRQRVGNYPGVTVARKSGLLKLPQANVEIVDLPGAYSLAAGSLDERIVVDFLSGNLPGVERPDAVICVADATQIKRNLFLVSQVAEAGLPMVLVLNRWDAACRQGLEINTHLLSERMGIPVVPAIATQKDGVRNLLPAIETMLREPRRMRPIEWPGCVDRATSILRRRLPGQLGETLSEVELHRILFDAKSAVLARIPWREEERLRALEEARAEIQRAGYNPMAAEALLHYEYLAAITEGVIGQRGDLRRGPTESIDRLLMHRGWGLLIFLAIMYVVFLSVYTWASPFMDGIEWAKGRVQDAIGPMLDGAPILQSLVTNGAIEGVGAFLVFLPQILILFFFIALLEDTGYMARAAFLMDRMFGWCGLNGKSFVPLLSSYACAVPGILATRTIEDPKARLVTILIAPFMSCSARLPVYVLLIGAFIEPRHGSFVASLALFGMHFVGLAAAIPTAFLFNRVLLRTPSQPFVLELPSYHVPQLRGVLWRMSQSGFEFVKRAGTVIFAITIIIWALLYFPRPAAVEEEARRRFFAEEAAAGAGSPAGVAAALDPHEDQREAPPAGLEHEIERAYLEQSFLGRFGRAVQPLFDPAGFDWRITIGVLASFPAREIIVSTLGVTYSLGGEVDEADPGLRAALSQTRWPEGSARAGQPVYTLPVVVAIMVFFALCSQCGATLAAIARESRAGWAVFSFLYMTVLAWLGAVFCYQAGSLLV
ncbi:MAG TPA: ferrous iron transport protein B [Verrucomicrobiales bacterium]|nr:ferrous iron transport protein B [Verrucomicrobiales bacterium]